MEVENRADLTGLVNNLDKTTYKNEDLKPPKSKTTLRIKYEVQADFIRREIGDLEEIRHKLGLSKRKICQMLLIDPSTWTRWTTFNDSKAPPHIYRMLQWYLLMMEKHPHLHQEFWLSAFHQSQKRAEDVVASTYGSLEDLKARIRSLEQMNRRNIYVFTSFLMLILGVFIFMLFRY